MKKEEQEEKCPDRLYKDLRDHPRDWYLKVQNKLEDKINKMIEKTEYKYCVAFSIDPKEDYPGRVTVNLLNKDVHNVMRDL